MESSKIWCSEYKKNQRRNFLPTCIMPISWKKESTIMLTKVSITATRNCHKRTIFKNFNMIGILHCESLLPLLEEQTKYKPWKWEEFSMELWCPGKTLMLPGMLERLLQPPNSREQHKEYWQGKGKKSKHLWVQGYLLASQRPR